MSEKTEPFLIKFPKIGESSLGFISVAENEKNIPFKVSRVFWTYFTPEEISRGGHAHHHTQMVLIAAAGNIKVHTETVNGKKETFSLSKPNTGLYLPRLCWHTMDYEHSSVQLVLASAFYSEGDYIRDYQEFKKLL